MNLIQHLIKSKTYETLKRVQGDKSGPFYETVLLKTLLGLGKEV